MKILSLLAHVLLLSFTVSSVAEAIDDVRTYPQESIQYEYEICVNRCSSQYDPFSQQGQIDNCMQKKCWTEAEYKCKESNNSILGCYQFVNYIDFKPEEHLANIRQCKNKGWTYKINEIGDIVCSDIENGNTSGGFGDFKGFNITPSDEKTNNKEAQNNDYQYQSFSQCPGSSHDSLDCFLQAAGSEGYVSAGQLLDLVDQSFESYSVDRKNRLKAQLEAIDYMESYNSDLLASMQDSTYLSEIKQCEQDKHSAKTCCSNAEACLTGTMNTTGFMNQFFGAAANVSMSRKMGAYDACNTMQNLSRGGSAATLALNSMCKNEVSNCSQSCGNVYKVSRDIEKNLNAKTSTGESICSTISGLTGQLTDYFNVEDYKKTCEKGSQTVASTQGMNQAICEDYEQSNWQQSTVALQQLAQSEIAARNCKKLVKGQSVASTNSSAPFNGNCLDPAHYYNSVCVQCRADSSLPQCAGITGLPEAQNNNANRDVSAIHQVSQSIASDSDIGVSAPVGFDEENDPYQADMDPISAKASMGLAQGSGRSGGSSGLGSRGGDSGGLINPMPEPGSISTKNGLLDLNILNGFRAGGGFKTSSGQYVSPMTVNKARRAVASIFNKMQRSHGDKEDFNLRKFLPPGSKFAYTEIFNKDSELIDEINKRGGFDDINREVANIERRQGEYGHRLLAWFDDMLGAKTPTALDFGDWFNDLWKREYLVNDEFVTFGHLFAIWSFRLILMALFGVFVWIFLGHWKENAQAKEFERKQLKMAILKKKATPNKKKWDPDKTVTDYE